MEDPVLLLVLTLISPPSSQPSKDRALTVDFRFVRCLPLFNLSQVSGTPISVLPYFLPDFQPPKLVSGFGVLAVRRILALIALVRHQCYDRTLAESLDNSGVFAVKAMEEFSI